MSCAYDVLEPLKDRSFHYAARRIRAIVSYSKRVSNLLALSCTYVRPDENLFTSMSLPAIRRRVHKIHRLWLTRLWLLGSNDLWLLQQNITNEPDLFDAEKISCAFKRLAACRCRCVVYAEGTRSQQRKINKRRVCRKRNICPHCWAYNAREQMRSALQYFSRLRKKNPNANVQTRCYVFEEKISSKIGGLTFSDPEVRGQEICKLQVRLEEVQADLSKLVRRFSASSWIRGLVYRIVLIPKESYWLLQVRIFTVGLAPNRKQKKVVLRGMEEKIKTYRTHYAYADRLNLSPKEKQYTYDQLLLLNAYPIELLTEDIETVAVAVNATAGKKLMLGSGAFRHFGADKRQRARQK